MQKSNVIYVDFINKSRMETVQEVSSEPRKAMTKGELHRLSTRVAEIEQTLSLCDDTFDSDVIENLHTELDHIDAILSEAKGA